MYCTFGLIKSHPSPPPSNIKRGGCFFAGSFRETFFRFEREATLYAVPVLVIILIWTSSTQQYTTAKQKGSIKCTASRAASVSSPQFPRCRVYHKTLQPLSQKNYSVQSEKFFESILSKNLTIKHKTMIEYQPLAIQISCLQKSPVQ